MKLCQENKYMGVLFRVLKSCVLDFLRVQYGEGINFMVVKPSNLAAWEIKQEVVPGSSSLSMFCQRKASSTNEK